MCTICGNSGVHTSHTNLYTVLLLLESALYRVFAPHYWCLGIFVCTASTLQNCASVCFCVVIFSVSVWIVSYGVVYGEFIYAIGASLRAGWEAAAVETARLSMTLHQGWYIYSYMYTYKYVLIISLPLLFLSMCICG